ncbi:MAG: PQQ-dependent sugar dehydrogenase, partial [Planctomycetota bacterium]
MSFSSLASSAQFLMGCALIALALLSPVAAQPPGFVHEYVDWVNGVGGATVLEFGPGARMYVAQKNGEIVVYQPTVGGSYDTPTSFGSVTVDSDGERGLLGMVLDPDFATNRHLFLFYSTATDQRLTRVTASTDYNSMVAGSEVVVLSGLPNMWPFHNAGDIHFHPADDVSIYVALGDDEFQSAAANLDLYQGKILKVDKNTGQGLPTNPFYDGDPDSVRSRVWAYGHRNPFRFTFLPDPAAPEVMWVSENGEAEDRMSWVSPGADGDWGTGNSFVFAPHPGHTILDTLSPSLVGIAIATSGPFADGATPVVYLSNWIAGVRRYRLTGPNLDVAEPMDGGGEFFSTTSGIDMEFGPDGALYMTRSGGGAGGDRVIHRLRWDGGAAPAASFTVSPDPAVGAAPLLVTFTDTSTDSDGTIAEWSWDFGDGRSSTDPSPQHLYPIDGEYTVTLTVTDNDGLGHTSAPLTVIVGSGCDDLTRIAETPGVDFAMQIQPIFNGNCSFCHNPGGQLPVLSTSAEANLIGVTSSDPSWIYVDPGSPETSLLFQKINCAFPSVGERMPVAGTLSPSDQALVRDWIAQLPVGPTEPPFVRGDANADGAFNIADAVSTLALLFDGASLPCDQAVDSNDDESLDIGDAIWTLAALFSSGPVPASPYPTCGPDGTAGALGCAAFTPPTSITGRERRATQGARRPVGAAGRVRARRHG